MFVPAGGHATVLVGCLRALVVVSCLVGVFFVHCLWDRMETRIWIARGDFPERKSLDLAAV